MNVKTPEARAQRRANLRRWEEQILEDGGRRVTVLLRREDAERLRRLEKTHGSMTAAIVAGLHALDYPQNPRECGGNLTKPNIFITAEL